MKATSPHSHLTLEYWLDDGWYVGRLKEAPGSFSQGRTLEELTRNVRDAHRLMMEEESCPVPRNAKPMCVLVEV